MKPLHAQTLHTLPKAEAPKSGKPPHCKSRFLKIAPMVAFGALCACGKLPAQNPLTLPNQKPVAAEADKEGAKKPSLGDFLKAHARDSRREKIISALSGMCIGAREGQEETATHFTHVPVELTRFLDASGSEEAARIMESVFWRLDSLEQASELDYDAIISLIIQNHPYLETVRVLGGLFSHPHFSDELLLAFASMMNPNPYCGYRYAQRDNYPPHAPYRWSACGYGGCSSGTDTDLDPLGEQETLHLQLMQALLQHKELPALMFSDISFVLKDITGPNYEGICTREGYMDAIESLLGIFLGKPLDLSLVAFLAIQAHNGNLYDYLRENESK